MKTTFGCLVTAWCAASVALASAQAADTATVKGDNVNVRGLPSLVGEVVTQVKSGETVVVLEEINLKKPKAGEPAKWFKIQMPTNTPVWVNSTFLDTNNMVVPAKLNLRAGPGENYSVVGRVDKGQPLKPIRTVEGWTEIEGVASSYAYVAADLLNYKGKEGKAETPATDKVEKAAEAKAEPAKEAEVKPVVAKEDAKPDAAKNEIIANEETLPARPPLEKEEMEEEPKVAAPVDIPVPKPAAKPITPPAPSVPASAPTNAPPLAPAPVLTPPPLGTPVPQVEEPAPKRVVAREGVIKGFVSIQAPTYFALHSTETGKLLNYLHPVSTNLVLKKLVGRKVIVSGEEEMDVRWPSTPVIKVKTLEIAP
jgi:uncharacterized protein YgiM (DUF1202 family)